MRLLTALAVVLLFTGTAAANIVTHPSFELGLFTGPSFDVVPAGSSNITGWAIGPDAVDWIGPFWQASDGAMMLDISRSTAGSVPQTLTTAAGQMCNVSFLMAKNPDDALIVETLYLTIGAGASESFNFDTTGASTANMLWTTKTSSFVAGGL